MPTIGMAKGKNQKAAPVSPHPGFEAISLGRQFRDAVNQLQSLLYAI